MLLQSVKHNKINYIQHNPFTNGNVIVVNNEHTTYTTRNMINSVINITNKDIPANTQTPIINFNIGEDYLIINLNLCIVTDVTNELTPEITISYRNHHNVNSKTFKLLNQPINTINDIYKTPTIPGLSGFEVSITSNVDCQLASSFDELPIRSTYLSI